MRKAPSDEALMSAYREGDVHAFEQLYARHKAGLYRYLVRQCRSRADAEELFQEVWMNLIRARARYEARAKFTTYLYHVAHNRLVDYYRRTKPHRQASAMPGDDEQADNLAWENLPAAASWQPDVQLDLHRHAVRLLELIQGLPAAQREALLLREEAGLSLEEIASVTEVNLETAKSRLRYAVAKLRQGMQADGMNDL